jgi:hypothetical protein
MRKTIEICKNVKITDGIAKTMHEYESGMVLGRRRKYGEIGKEGGGGGRRHRPSYDLERVIEKINSAEIATNRQA